VKDATINIVTNKKVNNRQKLIFVGLCFYISLKMFVILFFSIGEKIFFVLEKRRKKSTRMFNKAHNETI